MKRVKDRYISSAQANCRLKELTKALEGRSFLELEDIMGDFKKVEFEESMSRILIENDEMKYLKGTDSTMPDVERAIANLSKLGRNTGVTFMLGDELEVKQLLLEDKQLVTRK